MVNKGESQEPQHEREVGRLLRDVSNDFADPRRLALELLADAVSPYAYEGAEMSTTDLLLASIAAGQLAIRQAMDDPCEGGIGSPPRRHDG